jgi:hypothetical protein
MGKFLRGHRDRDYGGWMICGEPDSNGVVRWRLENAKRLRKE